MNTALGQNIVLLSVIKNKPTIDYVIEALVKMSLIDLSDLPQCQNIAVKTLGLTELDLFELILELEDELNLAEPGLSDSEVESLIHKTPLEIAEIFNAKIER